MHEGFLGAHTHIDADDYYPNSQQVLLTCLSCSPSRNPFLRTFIIMVREMPSCPFLIGFPFVDVTRLMFEVPTCPGYTRKEEGRRTGFAAQLFEPSPPNLYCVLCLMHSATSQRCNTAQGSYTKHHRVCPWAAQRSKAANQNDEHIIWTRCFVLGSRPVGEYHLYCAQMQALVTFVARTETRSALRCVCKDS